MLKAMLLALDAQPLSHSIGVEENEPFKESEPFIGVNPCFETTI